MSTNLTLDHSLRKVSIGDKMEIIHPAGIFKVAVIKIITLKRFQVEFELPLSKKRFEGMINPEDVVSIDHSSPQTQFNYISTCSFCGEECHPCSQCCSTCSRKIF